MPVMDEEVDQVPMMAEAPCEAEPTNWMEIDGKNYHMAQINGEGEQYLRDENGYFFDMDMN